MFPIKLTKNTRIGIVGLGYVGLPLAIEFGKKYPTIGYDMNLNRIKTLQERKDYTLEISSNEILKSKKLKFTNCNRDLEVCEVYIITVPTPVDSKNKPDLKSIKQASKSVAKLININNIVIYESTVYPGTTDEICVPILEKFSKLSFNKDFFCGYSPERINPGDKNHRITNIKKITSGSTRESGIFIDKLYKSIIDAGTHLASNIRVAEAAKVIENTQRDLNIALANELSLIFQKMNIDTKEVIDAAASKWNFSKFYPGLVGGHCIGVDPYYLTFKAKKLGYDPKVILSGRELNDSMSKNVVSQLCNMMRKQKILLSGANILVLGFTFKENCPDTRNSKVYDLVSELQRRKMNVHIYDPVLNHKKIQTQHPEFKFLKSPKIKFYEAIIVAVAHDDYKKLGSKKIKQYAKDKHILFDLKSLFSIRESDLRL
jgi:UDP-N-acetyl-D-galactosamine dehydrogenase